VVEELKPIAARHGRKMPHLALRWVLSNPAVSTAIVGMMKPQEVDDNLGALEWTLSDKDSADIDAVFARHGVETAPDIWMEQVWDEEG
jgi:aryl-alcohol dehydrogenase-like predicted oxidoreductase